MKAVVFSSVVALVTISGTVAVRRDRAYDSTRGDDMLSAHLSLSRLLAGHRNASCEASDLCDLVGYMIFDCSNVVGEFEGADFGKTVSLDNGMIFEFQEYNYTYSYRPDAIVFALRTTLQGRQVTLYRLLIEDEMYEVTRVK